MEIVVELGRKRTTVDTYNDLEKLFSKSSK